jgi:hypothetical protein
LVAVWLGVHGKGDATRIGPFPLNRVLLHVAS